MEGMFAPRSMELIWDTLSLVKRCEIFQRPVALHTKQFDAMAQPLTEPVLVGASEPEGVYGIGQRLSQLIQREGL